jgi:rubredoxin
MSISTPSVDIAPPRSRPGRRTTRWRCAICGFEYDEAQGLPHEGLSPGTAWDDIPDSWTCPDCGVRKTDFCMLPLELG